MNHYDYARKISCGHKKQSSQTCNDQHGTAEVAFKYDTDRLEKINLDILFLKIKSRISSF